MPTAGGAPANHEDAGRALARDVVSTTARSRGTNGGGGTRQIEIATIGDDVQGDDRHRHVRQRHHTSAQWSPDDKRILYQHTDYQNSADLGADAVQHEAHAAHVVDAVSIDQSISWRRSTTGPDGKSVPAWLFVPKGSMYEEARGRRLDYPDGVNMN